MCAAAPLGSARRWSAPLAGSHSLGLDLTGAQFNCEQHGALGEAGAPNSDSRQGRARAAHILASVEKQQFSGAESERANRRVPSRSPSSPTAAMDGLYC